MRKIKFRAWIKSLRIMAGILSIDSENETVLLKGYKRDTIASPNQVALLQYTGLKDKNGVDIYEGDIVRRRDFHCDEVYFYVGQINYSAVGVFAGQFVFRSQSGDLEGMYSRYGDEVIGNVYEDKELLEEENEKN